MLALAQACICTHTHSLGSAKEKKGKTNLSRKTQKRMNMILWGTGTDILSESAINFAVQGFVICDIKSFCCCRSPYRSLREIKRCIKAKFVLLTILRLHYIFIYIYNFIFILFKNNFRTIVLHYKSYFWSGISFCSPITNAEDSCYPTFTKFGTCSISCSFKFHRPVLLMVLFYCLSNTQLDTIPLYIAHPIFFILSPHNILNSFWNSSAFKTRPRTKYCNTISMVNEKVNVTYKMSINLMSVHFNDTLTQRRIKLLPRDQPNVLPW